MRKSAKEEAEELIQQFKRYSWKSCVEGYEEFSNVESAKYCAIIAQQRIINEAEFWHNTSSYEETTEFIAGEERVNYQREILKEIENL